MNQFHPPDGDSRLTAISIFLSLHGDNRFFFLGLTVACWPCSSSFKLNGFCMIFLRPDCRLLAMFKLLQAERPLHDIPLALRPRPLTAIFLLALRPCPLMAIFSSALRPRPLTAIFLWPCGCAPSRQFAPLGGSIFYFASQPRPLDNIIFYLALLAILSSIMPHGRAPPAILFSIQPNGHTILAKYFSIWPHGCASPGKILLITHQGFL
jgi:hypothetical protein